MQENREFEQKRGGAMWFGGAVYVGVVLAATTLFVSFILTAFPEDAYFTRTVMTVSGLLVGGSMLAFPVALHNWAISGTHRTVTIALYYMEMAIVALNTIVAFGSMLSKYSGYILPEWVSMYEPFSIVSIVFTLAAWGTVFQMDPGHMSVQKDLAAQQKYRAKIAEKNLEFLESIEGEEAILEAARAQIEKRYGAQRPTGEKKHFGAPARAQARGSTAPVFVRPVVATAGLNLPRMLPRSRWSMDSWLAHCGATRDQVVEIMNANNAQGVSDSFDMFGGAGWIPVDLTFEIWNGIHSELNGYAFRGPLVDAPLAGQNPNGHK
jgi:hypothetical protein